MFKQRGEGLIVLLIKISLAGAIILLGLKFTPAFREYIAVKNVFEGMSKNVELKTMSLKEIKGHFLKQAEINKIKHVNPEDVSLSTEGNQVDITAEYVVLVPIMGNVSIMFDFLASGIIKKE